MQVAQEHAAKLEELSKQKLTAGMGRRQINAMIGNLEQIKHDMQEMQGMIKKHQEHVIAVKFCNLGTIHKEQQQTSPVLETDFHQFTAKIQGPQQPKKIR